MSIRVMDWVWRQSKSRGVERLVLLAIADCANDEGEHAYPSIATLTSKAGIGESTTHRAIKALVDLGELRVTQNAGKRGTNLYAVIMDAGRGGSQSDTPGGPNLGPEPSVEPSERPSDSLRSSAARSSEVATVAPNAGVILAAYIDRCAVRPPGRVVGQLAKIIKELLDDSIPPRAIWNGLLAWGAKGSAPIALPGFVNAAANQAAIAASVPAPSTTDARATSILEAGRRLQARMDAEAGR